jgi:hypothetical protein
VSSMYHSHGFGSAVSGKSGSVENGLMSSMGNVSGSDVEQGSNVRPEVTVVESHPPEMSC